MNETVSVIKKSILQALQEERESPGKRCKKIGLSILSFGLPIAGLLWIFFKGQFNAFWFVASIVWLSIGVAAAFSYWKPQPRLIVPGFWTPWLYGKLLFLFLMISALQLVICPHLAMLSPSNSFQIPLFESLQKTYMDWGGMPACMFFCGMTFSALSAAIIFFVLRRATFKTRGRQILKISALALLCQLPIAILQISDIHLRTHFGLWLLGSFLGILSVASLFKR